MAGKSKKSSSSSSRSKSSSRKKSRKYGPKAKKEVRTEMHHMRSGKHKVKNRKQAIAIGLSKAAKGAKVPKESARKRPRRPRKNSFSALISGPQGQSPKGFATTCGTTEVVPDTRRLSSR